MPIRYDNEDLGNVDLEKTVTFELENTTIGGVINSVADAAGWEMIVEATGLRLKRKQRSLSALIETKELHFRSSFREVQPEPAADVMPFPITDTELKLIATAASIGLSVIPQAGQRTPAAIEVYDCCYRQTQRPGSGEY